MTLGTQIKRRRELIEISQPALAERCGWDSQSRISNYENDSREPKVSDLKKIAKALGCSPCELLADNNVQELKSNYQPTYSGLSTEAKELINLVGSTSREGKLSPIAVTTIKELIKQIAR